MHYNNYYAREQLLAHQPGYYDNAMSKVLAFVNLCIYPHKFESVYQTIHDRVKIPAITYDCLKGAIMGLLVMGKRCNTESHHSVDEYVIDFIDFIRQDKRPDPVRFLLSMRMYLPRYLFVKGLKVAFGLDWKVLVADALDLQKLPKCTTYHGLCSNLYVRNLLRAYVVYKFFREPHEEGYKKGENDIVTLTKTACSHKTSFELERMQALVDILLTSLPSWCYNVRRQAAYAIDTSQDGFSIIARSVSDPEKIPALKRL
jgi:hypothetical protein